MFKTRLPQNKETVVAVALGVGLVFMLLINIIFLLPKIIEVYTGNPKPSTALPIDIEVVNKAVQYLSP